MTEKSNKLPVERMPRWQ